MADYFYTPPGKITAAHLVIDGEEFSHLVHVMRKKEGDEIRVVDGKGTAYDTVIRAINRKIAECDITTRYERHHESALDATLAVGVLKNPSKFDFLVEKATELGVNRFVPLRTARTITHHAKADRWRKLALSAMKQSGRSFLPEVGELVDFGEFLEGIERGSQILIAHEQPIEGSSDLKFGTTAGPVVMLVGPEGGFTDEEVERSVRAGARAVYLGERRLRTETAAIIMSSLVLLGRDP